MISVAGWLACATFFINHENRAFLRKHVITPTAHTVTKVERIVRKPFHKRKP